jgi:hypothetical protein
MIEMTALAIESCSPSGGAGAKRLRGLSCAFSGCGGPLHHFVVPLPETGRIVGFLTVSMSE